MMFRFAAPKIGKRPLVRVCVWVAAFALVGYVGITDMYPTGSAVFTSDFNSFTPYISILTPAERTEIGRPAIVTQEPVYFDVTLPRDFESADIDLGYTAVGIPVIEMGPATGSEASTAYELHPVENAILDTLGWEYIEEDELRLYQKNPKYTSIDRFINFLPDTKEVAVYNASIPYQYSISGYVSDTAQRIISYPLIGSYSFMTYVSAGETLSYNFAFDDAPAVIRVYKDAVLVREQTGDPTVRVEGLEAGVYTIEVTRPAESITAGIVTTQQKIAFIDTIRLGMTPGSVTLVTSMRSGRAISYSAAGLQHIDIDGSSLAIDEPYAVYEFSSQHTPARITIPQGELLIAGKGLISFSDQEFFNPMLQHVVAGMDIEHSDVAYILARYQTPERVDDHRYARVHIPLTHAHIKDGKLRFALSLQGIHEDSRLAIEHVRIRLSREPLRHSNIFDFFYTYLAFIYKQYVR